MTKRYCICDSDYPMRYDAVAHVLYCLDCERVVPVQSVRRSTAVRPVRRSRPLKTTLTV